MTSSRLATFTLFTALVSFVSSISVSVAGELPWPAFVSELKRLEKVPHAPLPDYSFVEPNELHPEKAAPIFSQAPQGAYLTVGTERAFIAAGLNANISHLLILDRDPGVAFYNEINVALLKSTQGSTVSEIRKNYLQLRLEGSLEDWKKAMAGIATTEKIVSYFEWWKKSVRLRKSKAFELFHSGSTRVPGSAFSGSNYLYDDELFSRVYTLARTDRIQSIVFDLSDVEGFKQISQLLAQAEVPVGVFDISNAWYEKYMGRKPFNQLLHILDQAKRWQDSSLVLLTDHHNRIRSYRNGLPARRPSISTIAALEEAGYHDEYDWAYHGYTVKHLRSQSRDQSIEIPRDNRLKTSSLNEVSTTPEMAKTGNWCTRFLRAILPI